MIPQNVSHQMSLTITGVLSHAPVRKNGIAIHIIGLSVSTFPYNIVLRRWMLFICRGLEARSGTARSGTEAPLRPGTSDTVYSFLSTPQLFSLHQKGCAP